MTDLAEIKEAFGEHAEAINTTVNALKSENGQLRERIEELEARRNSPGKTGSRDPRKDLAFKVFETSQGPVYEVPAETKIAELLPPDKPPEISLERWLAATMAGERCQDKEALDFARDKKQLVTTTSGVLIPEEYQSRWIDLIRAQQVLNAAGMTTTVMQAKTLNASAVITDPAATWHTEAGAISADNPTFAARTLTAQTLVVRCQGSVELAQDSPDFGAQLSAVMTRAMAVELDRVGLIGSGTPPEPQGILGASGVGRVQNVGAVTDYGDLLEGVRTLLDSNVPLDIAAANAIMSPSVWATYEGLATGIASDKTQLPRPRALETTAFRVTSNGLDDGSPVTSTIFMGDFSDLVLGVRREAAVEALKLTTYASNLLLEFVGYLRADFMIRRPGSFVTIEGVTPAS